jgi:hypothetical protein
MSVVVLLIIDLIVNAIDGVAGSGAVAASWQGTAAGRLWCAALTTAVLALALGVRLMQGRRRLVLFLRRFGYTAATHAATVAAASIGGRWRLVTLDDAQIVPVGVGPVYEALSAAGRGRARLRRINHIGGRVVRWVLLLTVLGAVIDAAVAGAHGIDIRLNEHTTAAAVLRALVVIAAVSAGLGAVAWAIRVVGLLFFPLLMVGAVVANSIRDAEGSKVLAVPDAHAIVTARDRVKRLSRRVFSSRLVVLRVDSSIWQLAVNGVASVADVPLVDISEPTDNLLWEIEQLNARFGPRCVFVGEYARVVHLGALAPADSGVQQVQRLLDGRTVLAYTTDVAGTKRFTRALRSTLEQSLRIPLTGLPVADALPRRLVVDARREALRERRRAQLQRRPKEKPAVGPDRERPSSGV